jgi:hypothetical protein
MDLAIGAACVSRVYTDYGVFLLTDHGVVARETYGMSRNDLSDGLGVTSRKSQPRHPDHGPGTTGSRNGPKVSR